MGIIRIVFLATAIVLTSAQTQKEFAVKRGPTQCERRLNKASCPLFNFQSDLVTKDEFIAKVMAESSGWITIYSLEIDSPSNYAKCLTKWNPLFNGDEFLKQETCTNLDTSKCDIFDEIVRITEDECGRVRLVGVNASSTDTFVSQDLDSYFWRSLCVEPVDEYTCSQGRYVDLNVKRERILNSPNRVSDITGLPWDLIAADMKNVYGKNIGDPDVRFSFLGPECDVQ